MPGGLVPPLPAAGMAAVKPLLVVMEAEEPVIFGLVLISPIESLSPEEVEVEVEMLVLPAELEEVLVVQMVSLVLAVILLDMVVPVVMVELVVVILPLWVIPVGWVAF